MNKIIIVILAALSLAACGDKKVKKESKLKQKVKVISYEPEVIWESKDFRKEKSIENLKPGDFIEIKFKTTEYRPQFSRIYSVKIKSTWLEINKNTPFKFINKSGNCFVHRKRKLDFKVEEIKSSAKQMKIFVGNNELKFKAYEEFDGVLTLRKKISKADMKNFSTFRVKVVQPKSKMEKYGYIGIGSPCDGLGQLAFKHLGNVVSHVAKSSPENSLDIQVSLLKEVVSYE